MKKCALCSTYHIQVIIMKEYKIRIALYTSLFLFQFRNIFFFCRLLTYAIDYIRCYRNDHIERKLFRFIQINSNEIVHEDFS